ncbi:MAG: isoprenylcysteine carboxylmethyltransferase family protein [Acidobacteria bacterium]|nr:isoprenylcysteine carboxylmethyltransferase family protein [Acidobacteriota bacterium]
MSSSYSAMAARIRVPSGFLLAAIYGIFAQPTPARLLWGGGVALAGLLLRAWSAGHLEKNRQLATSGPYAYTRNPLYIGSALAGIGFCIAGGRWWFFVLLGVFLTAVYWPVIRREEAHLRQLFPGEFAAYADSVPAIVPRLIPWRETRVQARFSWKQYRQNREYEALFAYAIILLFLFGKMFAMN